MGRTGNPGSGKPGYYRYQFALLFHGADGFCRMISWRRFIIMLGCVIACGATAQDTAREKVLVATLAPYDGPSEHGVDTSTLTGKVMCGYQGWFNCDGDGAGRGWAHW